MKKLFIVIMILLLSGCNNSAYEKALEKANTAMENGEYEKAFVALEMALEEKSNEKEVQKMYHQLLAYRAVKDAIEEENWKTALTQANSLLEEKNLDQGLKEELQNSVKIAETNMFVSESIEEIKRLINEENVQEANNKMAELKENEDTQNILDHYSVQLDQVSNTISQKLQKQEEKVAAEKEAEKEAKKEAEKAKAEDKISKKEEYRKKLQNIENGLAELDYLYENGVTIEVYEAVSKTHQRWDDALNEIYGVLKQQLSTEEMNALKQEQRQWIVNRDKTAEAESAPFEGGTWEKVQYTDTLARLTRERCYELVEIYMK